MLETVDLTLSLTKDAYKKKAPPIREKLRLLQYQCKDAEIPIVIVFEGWTRPAREESSRVCSSGSIPGDSKSIRPARRQPRKKPSRFSGGTGYACRRMGRWRCSTGPGTAAC